jgi:FkbM family methyltransferase
MSKYPYRRQLGALPGLRAPLELLTHDPRRDLVSRKIHAEGIWEPFETALWLACQQPGAVTVDAGANLGYFSLLSALHEHPPAAVFAFEPAADNFALLCANLQHNRCGERVLAVHAALGERPGTAVLHRSADNLGDHQLSAGDGPRVQESVAVVCGAEVLREHTDRIDLLKVDTQGSEHAVLKGLLPLLQGSGRGLRMLVELTPYSLRAAGSSGRELLELIAELELPLAIVDHIEHRLVPSDAAALCEWSDNVDGVSGDQGFMNIFAGSAPEGF